MSYSFSTLTYGFMTLSNAKPTYLLPRRNECPGVAAVDEGYGDENPHEEKE